MFMREWAVIHPCGREQVWANGEPTQSFELIWPIRGVLLWPKRLDLTPSLMGHYVRAAQGGERPWPEVALSNWGTPKGADGTPSNRATNSPLKGGSGGGTSPFPYICGYNHRHYSFTWWRRAESRYPREGLLLYLFGDTERLLDAFKKNCDKIYIA